MSKEYICMCGREFDTKQQLGGHHSHCELFLTHTGRLHIRQAVDSSNGVKTSRTLKAKHQKEKDKKLQDWLNLKPQCETCGKVMTEKFGSGRFCCKSCANRRTHSEETKRKIGSSITSIVHSQQGSKLINLTRLNHIKAKERYEQNPNYCIVCNGIIPYEKRTNQTCGEICHKKLQSKIMANCVLEHGGNLNPDGPLNRKWGFYHGVKCDSSWELAFLLYCLDHKISIKRNKKYFLYLFKGIKHKYYPDSIVDGQYIEIKGRYKEEDYEKINQFPQDKRLIVIDKANIKKYLKYCIEKYGKDFIYIYDKDKNSWMKQQDKASTSQTMDS